MTAPRVSLVVTGATGLLGRGVVRALAADARVERIYTPVRTPQSAALRSLGSPACRVIPLPVDFGRDDLGMPDVTRQHLADEVTAVVHLAANTSFAQPLDEARAINRDGTRRLLAVTAEWPRVRRWVYVSTAFVAGDRTGVILERDAAGVGGWVNAYEQSKSEAESLVRGARQDWVIARPSTVVCDDMAGRITQVNAVHRALRLYFGGLAAMLPGSDASTLDVVTAEHVVRGITRLALGAGAARAVYHLCAGAGAMPLDELLDVTHDAFARSAAWRRRGIARPVRTDLETYRIFERAITDAGSDRVRRAVQSLAYFVPQLAFPKRFDTTAADALLGAPAPAVRDFWANMVATLAGGEQAAAGAA